MLAEQFACYICYPSLTRSRVKIQRKGNFFRAVVNVKEIKVKFFYFVVRHSHFLLNIYQQRFSQISRETFVFPNRVWSAHWVSTLKSALVRRLDELLILWCRWPHAPGCSGHCLSCTPAPRPHPARNQSRARVCMFVYFKDYNIITHYSREHVLLLSFE